MVFAGPIRWYSGSIHMNDFNVMACDATGLWRSVAGKALMLATVALMLVGSSASAAETRSFCGDRIAHDYAAPFSRMPKLHRPPPTGRLPFAPPHTSFNRSESPILAPGNPGGSEYSYSLEAEPGNNRTFTLNWTVLARLIEVNRFGESERVIDIQRREIGRVSETEFNRIVLHFAIGPRPAFYRVDTFFRRANGQRLARYGEYLRVVKPNFSAHLVINSGAAKAGDALLFRVTNPGTELLRFGEAFSIEQFVGDAWGVFPASIGPWHRVLLSLPPGQKGKCQTFTIPENMPPGRYRIKKDLNGGKPPLKAEFQVQG